jgi:hypothetical protein
VTIERCTASLQVGVAVLWGLFCIKFLETLLAYVGNGHIFTDIVSVGSPGSIWFPLITKRFPRHNLRYV